MRADLKLLRGKDISSLEREEKKLKIYSFRGSTMVVRRPVKAMVVGSNPTRGAPTKSQIKLAFWLDHLWTLEPIFD